MHSCRQTSLDKQGCVQVNIRSTPDIHFSCSVFGRDLKLELHRVSKWYLSTYQYHQRPVRLLILLYWGWGPCLVNPKDRALGIVVSLQQSHPWLLHAALWQCGHLMSSDTGTSTLLLFICSDGSNIIHTWFCHSFNPVESNIINCRVWLGQHLCVSLLIISESIGLSLLCL